MNRFFFSALAIGFILLSSSFSIADEVTSVLQLTPVQTIHNPMIPYQKNAVEHEYDPNHFFQNKSPQQEQAFQGVANQTMPMTPEQIIRLKKMVDETKRAAAVPATTPPKPALSTSLVSLAPGAVPPVIRLQQGFVTSVVFVDSTGASWPIESYDVGDPQAFNIQWEGSGNMLMVQAMKMYAFGNLAVKLQGLSTPVMVTLIPGQNEVDYRADLRIQQPGPLAQASAIAAPHQAADSALLGILDSIPPDGSQSMEVSGGNAEAWVYNNQLFLRTRLTLLSPSWNAVMSSPDGTNAYELDKTSTILVSQNGTPVQLKIEGL
jgi:intracellular multiplication protein IcmK